MLQIVWWVQFSLWSFHRVGVFWKLCQFLVLKKNSKLVFSLWTFVVMVVSVVSVVRIAERTSLLVCVCVFVHKYSVVTDQLTNLYNNFNLLVCSNRLWVRYSVHSIQDSKGFVRLVNYKIFQQFSIKLLLFIEWVSNAS